MGKSVKKGFTLVELMISVALIGIGILCPAVTAGKFTGVSVALVIQLLSSL